MPEREQVQRGSFRTVTPVVAVPLIALAVFFFWNWLHGGVTPVDAADAVVAARTSFSPAPLPSLPDAVPLAPTAAQPEKALTPYAPAGPGDIVLIIDDLGFDGQPLERLMALDPNINASILPNGTRAAEVAEMLHARGFEILCHLPMQPRGRQRPGRNAILTSMTDEEIARLTRENIAAIPHARGVNNHMGSLATTDRRVMASVIEALPDGMYFIDSLTSGKSVAATVARELNVRSATRHVFLDDVATEAAVRQQVRALAAAASRHGVAIGIGHPYQVTMRVLADELPRLRERGFRLVRASEVVR